MPKAGIPSWCFVLVVAQLGHRFLVVRETKHGQRWYLPAGRVERGETFAQAAVREVREEAGVDVHLTGLLRVEHNPQPVGDVRFRVFFLARPVDDTPPKQTPDQESLEARWVTLDELKQLPLRDPAITDVLDYVSNGARITPVGLFTDEGAPWE